MKNAPATFQQLMNLVTAGFSNVVTYIDDVEVHSASWSWSYLGHEVGHGKVLSRLAKVRAILDLPIP